MFQSTSIAANVQRPVILHAYGGAKVHMESALQTLRLQGWIPMASALVGTAKRPPMWTTNDLRVTAGTSIDLAIRPNPLTQKEDLLLLSLWRRYCQVPKGCALGTWLMGVNKELGPDNDESPHKLASPQNVDYPATEDIIRSTAGDLSSLATYRLPFLVADVRPRNLCYLLQHLKLKTWTWQFWYQSS